MREETKLTPLGLVAQVVTHAVPGEVLQMWQQYAHDHNDRVAMTNDSHFGQSAYSYDAEGQLLSAVTANAEQRFAYDPVGNRTSAAGIPATFDVSNQMLAAGAERMVYDKQGNLISRDGGNGVARYEFSTRNLLKWVVRADGLRIEFSYDAFGRRVSKRVGEVVTRYMWFGNHLIYEWVEGDPSIHSEYLYKPGTHEPLAMRQNGAVYYFHNGHDGAPRRLSDSAGRIVWMGQYDAFGSLLRRQGDVIQPLRFAGQYADEETGLYYNLARYYAPELGRYISRDPLDLAAGPNAYLYCYNDPIGGRDPTGLLSGFWKVAAAVAICAVGVAVIIVAAPIVAAAVAGAAVTATAIGAAGAVVGGAALVGAGLGLGMAPDGCVACQKKAMIDGAFAFAGAAITAMSIALCPPLAGAGLALAGGGAVGGGSALGLAGVVVGVAGVLGAAQHAMSGSSDGGGSESEPKDNEPPDERRRLIKKPPDGHAFEKHGGSVTDEQLETRARTGVAPDGSTGPNGSIPPEASAFNSDEDLLRADQAVRNGPLQDQIAQNPNATKIRVDKAPVGFDAGRSYSRVGPSQQSATAPSQGPLQRTDGVRQVTGTYVKNPVTGEWETVTLYPDP